MTEVLSNPDLVPFSISFEGSIPAEKLTAIAAILGAISTELQISLTISDSSLKSQETKPTLDVGIGKNDIFRVAEDNNISRIVAGRTFGVINKFSERYGDDRFLLPDGGYSSKALREANQRGDLEAMIGMGPKSCALVDLVIMDVESRILPHATE